MMSGVPGIAPTPMKGVTDQHLICMKLRSPGALDVHKSIKKWVMSQSYWIECPAPTALNKGGILLASTLLLHRLAVAFDRRLFHFHADRPSTEPANPKKLKLEAMMTRNMKVTRMVLESIQFIGTDLVECLTMMKDPPCVTEVADSCLNILDGVPKLTNFCSIYAQASKKEAERSNALYFGVFALQTLKVLKTQCKDAFYFAKTFEYLYNECCRKISIKQAFHALNSIGISFPEPNGSEAFTEALNISWKLARLLLIKANQENEGDPDRTDHRRNHFLIVATSILIAANLGKVTLTSDVESSCSVTSYPATLRADEDFVATIAATIINLMQSIDQHASFIGAAPITTNDIRSHFERACMMIKKLPILRDVTGKVLVSELPTHSIFARVFTPSQEHFLLLNYRAVISHLGQEISEAMKIHVSVENNTADPLFKERKGIAKVLLLYPMVIGEQWGLNRNAPTISSKLLYSEDKSITTETSIKNSETIISERVSETDKRQLLHGISYSESAKTKRQKTTENKSTDIDDQVTTIGSAIGSAERSSNPNALVSDLVSTAKRPQTPQPEEIQVRYGTPETASREKKNLSTKEIEPPVVSDFAELNDWLVSLSSLSVIRPSDALLRYLRENDSAFQRGSSCLTEVIIPTLIRGIYRIESVHRSRSTSKQNLMVGCPILTLGSHDGQLYVKGQIDDATKLCASVIGLYYFALEKFIEDQMARMQFMDVSDTTLQSQSFHRGLLASCFLCVNKGIGMIQKNSAINQFVLTTQDVMNTTEVDAFSFLKAIKYFSNAFDPVEDISVPFTNCIHPTIPKILRHHCSKIETQVTDSMIWCSVGADMTSLSYSSLPQIIKTMQKIAKVWPPDILEPILPEELMNQQGDSVPYKSSFESSSEMSFVSFVVRRTCKNVFHRIEALCAALEISGTPSVNREILVAFRHLLRHHISVFTDRHVDQILLCCMFGVCRMMNVKPVITFRKIIDAYLSTRVEEQGERACRRVVRFVKLQEPSGKRHDSQSNVGNIITFYNSVFIPTMERYFIESKSLSQSATAYQRQRSRNLEEEVVAVECKQSVSRSQIGT